jgi:hypothetical protein
VSELVQAQAKGWFTVASCLIGSTCSVETYPRLNDEFDMRTLYPHEQGREIAKIRLDDCGIQIAR